MKINRDGQAVIVTMTDNEAAGLYDELLWAKGLDEDGPGRALWTALEEAGCGGD